MDAESGSRIRERREAAGLTLDQLAYAVRVSPHRMMSIEAGAEMDAVLARRIEAALARQPVIGP